MPDLAEYLQFAERLARQAGEMMHGAQGSLEVTMKADHSPVTKVDREVNEMVISEVQEVYPAHGVLGEEASHNDQAEELWVCDPIDGTVAFMVHMPVSAFSIALVRHGEPIVAVIYNPWIDALYSAVKGEGASRNGQTIHVSTRGRQKEERILLAGKGSNAYRGLLSGPEAQRELRTQNWYILHCSGLAFRGCLVAEGALDATVYNYVGAHDVAALQLIVSEAGGRVTNIQGNPQRYDGPIKGALISNGIVHDRLQSLVAISLHEQKKG